MQPNKIRVVQNFQTITRDRWGDAQAEALTEKLTTRVEALRRPYADAPKAKMRHLDRMILPTIAGYEIFRRELPDAEALEAARAMVLTGVPEMAETMRKIFRIPGLYRLVPRLFAKVADKKFGTRAGFRAKKYEVEHAWRIDMTACPYWDACREHGCPELCTAFCDSDDLAYDNLHPKLCWHRTKTLGRGGDCCDFSMSVKP